MSHDGRYAKPRLAGRGFTQSTGRLVAPPSYRNGIPGANASLPILPLGLPGAGDGNALLRGGLPMTDAPSPTHRQAALALLSKCPNLPHKAAGFLGHVCVAPTLSDRQRGWLEKLLDRNGFPPLAEGGAA